MRHLLTLTACLLAAPAVAGEQAVELGVHAGLVGFDGTTLPALTWYASPRVTFWFARASGVELDVGVSAGPSPYAGARYLTVLPTLLFVGNTMPDAKVQPIITAGIGAAFRGFYDIGDLTDDGQHRRMGPVASLGTGVIVPITGPLSIRADLRGRLTAGGTLDFFDSAAHLDVLLTAGLGLKIGVGKDSDGDGISDKKDGCPLKPEDADGFEDADGCPEADNDSDGILDADDSCPVRAEDLDGFEDEDGCADADNDGDGVLDGDDTCPVVAGTAATAGCPDADGDGVADGEDSCPELAGDIDGCPDSDGDGLVDPDDECPQEVGPAASFGCPDRDGDRVPDVRDECPDEAAQAGIDAKRSDGCPRRVYVAEGAIVIEDQVYFNSGRATIKSASYSLLREIAGVLQLWPQIKKVRIEGHTDSQGAEATNLNLSRARAAAVSAFLTKQGVDDARLEYEGYGESQPIADNSTSAGRAQNRRVAFTILEQEQRRKVIRADAVKEGDQVEGEAP